MHKTTFRADQHGFETFELAPPKEIAIGGENAQPLLDVVFSEYRPNQVVAWKEEGVASAIPLLEERKAMEGKATAYVCQNFACRMPVTEVGELAKQLGDQTTDLLFRRSC